MAKFGTLAAGALVATVSLGSADQAEAQATELMIPLDSGEEIVMNVAHVQFETQQAILEHLRDCLDAGEKTRNECVGAAAAEIARANLDGTVIDAQQTLAPMEATIGLAPNELIQEPVFCDYAADDASLEACNPAKVRLPFVDLDYLGLRDGEGRLKLSKIREIYGVVAAYWEAKGDLAIEPDFVAGLCRRDLNDTDIIRCIQISTGKDGKLIKASGRGHDIMTAVIDAYLSSKGLPPDAEISRVEMKNLIDRWLAATRSAPLGSAEMQNSVLHWSEYRRLGLIDKSGTAQVDQVRLIAEKIFKFDTRLTFKQISAWIDQYHPPQITNAQQTPKGTRALLKKKRKKGKLNLKRGRR